jgi:hypothetical protein
VLRNTDNNIYIQAGSGNAITFLDSSQNTMLSATPTSHSLQISNGNAFSIDSNRDISFYEDTGTTAKFFWDSSTERLGIGTSSPSQTLETVGSIFINAPSGNPDITIKTAGTGNNPFVAYRAGDNIVFDNMLVASAATDYWRVGYGASGTITDEYLVVTSAGNIGIGTASPKGKINSDVGNTTTVGAFSSSGLNITSTSGATNNIYQIGFGYASGATNAPASIYALTTSNAGFNNNAICFATRGVTTDTAPTERMRIDSSGNVGIGVVPTAAYKMQVNVATNTVSTGSPVDSSLVHIAGGTTTVGDGVSLQLTNISGAKETGWRISAVTTSGNNGDLVFNAYAGGADYPERLRIDAAGNLQMGVAGTNNGRLDITPEAALTSLTLLTQQAQDILLLIRVRQ